MTKVYKGQCYKNWQLLTKREYHGVINRFEECYYIEI